MMKPDEIGDLHLHTSCMNAASLVCALVLLSEIVLPFAHASDSPTFSLLLGNAPVGLIAS